MAPAGMFFIMDDQKNPIPCRDYRVIEQWLEGRKYRGVRLTMVRDYRNNRSRVSTVFLCLDYSDMLFETMVFPKNYGHDNYMIRAQTWHDAVKNHKSICRQLKQGRLIIE